MKRTAKVIGKVKNSLVKEDVKAQNNIQPFTPDSHGTHRVSVKFDWINGRMIVVQ